jgi:glycerol uptake facilitator-like aquaporin
MNKYVVEFLGTLLLVFVILASGNYLAIGAALSLAVLLGGPVSGGAFNPAVVLAYLAAGKLAASDVVPFIVVEVAGALAAFQLYKMIL